MLYLNFINILAFRIKSKSGKYVKVTRNDATLVDDFIGGSDFDMTDGEHGKKYFNIITSGLSLDVKGGWGTALQGWPTVRHYNLEFIVKDSSEGYKNISWFKGSSEVCMTATRENKVVELTPCNNSQTQLFRFVDEDEELKGIRN